YTASRFHGIGGVRYGAISLADGDACAREALTLIKAHPVDAVMVHGKGMVKMFRRVDGRVAGNCQNSFESRLEYFHILRSKGIPALWRALRNDPAPFNSVFFFWHLFLLAALYAGAILSLTAWSRLTIPQRVIWVFLVASIFYF